MLMNQTEVKIDCLFFLMNIERKCYSDLNKINGLKNHKIKMCVYACSPDITFQNRLNNII